ncbi:zincin [Tilletiaria anomala UBC 951]|uniref:mitochondrial intermediate peptidase n=1 Tax=Tilletiaria anomala (strain ATCC 24038 / CBS 436.72 / UBC 951) TaxID=1037660 RepID=A0A066VAB6_TILAU|nr:zincin [Tilletiaria anomala UBC 951]KDN37233.1 zincin [Tilletiaria anomala UBC 951]
MCLLTACKLARPLLSKRLALRGILLQADIEVSTKRIFHATALNSRHSSNDLSHSFRDLREVIDNFGASCKAASGSSTGLFGETTLKHPRDFLTIARKSQERASVLVRRITEAPRRGPREMAAVVRNIDRLSDMLCKVIDMAEFVRTAHPDPDWSSAAEQAHQYLCNYMNVLNTSTGMYQTLAAAIRAPEVKSLLSPEGLHVAHIFLQDFEKSAIHLPEHDRQRFVSLSDSVLSLSTAFSQNLQAGEGRPPARFQPSWLASLPEPILQGIMDESLCFDGIIELRADSPYLMQIIRNSTNASAREAAYRSAFASGKPQKALLEALLERRAQLAKLSGYESFAHMVLKDKMARDPGNVIRFLHSQLSLICGNVEKEVQLLLSQQRPQLGSARLRAWDREFLANRHIDHFSPPTTPLSQFFSVGTVFSGISRLFSHLFGMHLQLVPSAAGEVWCKDVLKLEVIDEDAGGPVGVIYADLWSRAGKPSGAAHFTVRCSRRVDLDEEQDDIDSVFSGGDLPTLSDSPFTGQPQCTNDREGLYQQPIVALLCDFRRPSAGNSPSFLQWPEIETLFHEMGHALHSMVGRTEFQNVSGTRCATDFVEVPSILMEHFLTDPSVLPLFARHYSTDQPLPYEHLQKHLHSASQFKHLERYDELLLSLLDQRLHLRSPEDSRFDSTSTFEQAQEEAALLTPVQNLDWQGRFAHLVSYPASYYSYPLDRAIASALWEQLFRPDALSRRQGQLYKESVLAPGGGKDARSLIQSVLPTWNDLQ